VPDPWCGAALRGRWRRWTLQLVHPTDTGGAPVTLISTLARHTKNLMAAPAASLMIDLSNTAGDAESGGRITLMGCFTAVPPDGVRERFLARHPTSSTYADFADFTFYRFEIASAHMIEGFGRIVPLAAAALRPPPYEAKDFADTEARYLADLRQRWPAVSGLDAEGVDVRTECRSERHAFASAVTTAEAAYRAAANCLEAVQAGK
jgi:heme iron utilization protein